MKKILLLLSILVSINGLAQFPATQSQGTINTKVVSNGGFQAMKGLINGVYTDTTAANAGYIDFYTGAQIYCTSDQYFYLRDTLPMRWTKMAKFSDITGSSNIEYKQGLYNEGIVVFYDDFKRDYFGSDYTLAFPATTETISSDGLNLVGAPGNFSNYISRNYYTASESFSLKMSYVNNVLDGSSYGITIGMRSQNTECCTHHVTAGIWQTGGNLGKAYIVGGDAYGYQSTGSDAISLSAGDTVTVELIRNGLTYIVNVTNETTDETSTNTVVTDLALTPTNFYVNNTSLPTINFLGGDITVISEEYRLLDAWNADYAFVGNSITVGSAATAYNLTYPNRTFENDSGIVVITTAGGGDHTQSIVDLLPELYKLKPRYVPLMIGGNDILFGISTATWQQNLRIIRDSLTAHGIQVIHLYPTPRNGTDESPLVDFLDTCINFTNDIKVRATWDSLVTGGTSLKSALDAGDGLHLNDSGHHYVALKIRQALTPRVRTELPTVPLMSLIADGYDENKKKFLSSTGWDTIPRGSSGSTPTTPAGSFGHIQLNRGGLFASGGSDSLTFGSTFGLNVKDDIRATGSLVINQTGSSNSTWLTSQEIASGYPQALLTVGSTSAPTRAFFGVAPFYDGANSPFDFYISSHPIPTVVGYQTVFHQDASGNFTQISWNNLTSVVKKNYYFNATALDGTGASLILAPTRITLADSVYATTIPYNSGAGIVHLGIDTVASSPTFGKLVRKTAGGSTPTLQQVTTAGQTTTQTMYFTHASGTYSAQISKDGANGRLTLFDSTNVGSLNSSYYYNKIKYKTYDQTFQDAAGTIALKQDLKYKGFFLESPTSSEAVDMWQTPVAITVSSLKAILRGSTPSVTYNIKFGTDITSATSVFTSDITCTSITTGCSNSSGFNDATIPAGSFIWIVTTAASGTISSIGFTLNYTED